MKKIFRRKKSFIRVKFCEEILVEYYKLIFGVLLLEDDVLLRNRIKLEFFLVEVKIKSL